MPELAVTGAEELARYAPELVPGWQAALPGARATIATRLAEALWREDIGDARQRWHGRLHGFDRMVLPGWPGADPLGLAIELGLPSGFRAELASAVLGLALARARRQAIGWQAPAATLTADQCVVRWEQLATDGHNLHPCGRTRLGWQVADLLAHDLETPFTQVRFIGVREEFAHGSDLAPDLACQFGVRNPSAGYRMLPVHAWQLGRLEQRHPDWFAGDLLRRLDGVILAQPTAALRTLLLPGGRYLKLSLDILVTSTQRTISLASAHNGPVLSALLSRLLADDPDGHRVLLLPEVAGAGVRLGSTREATAILRDGMGDRLLPGEQAIPAAALAARDPATGRTVLAGLADRFPADAALPPAGRALAFLLAYARLLLPVVLRLAARSGVGLEAHLQNCIPTFRDGRPYRLGLRDFAGLRVHLPRLAEAAGAVALWPGSVIATEDVRVLQAKVGYTVFQAHLGELILKLTESHDLSEAAAWAAVRQVVDEVLGGHPDHVAYTARTMAHKALTRMRLAPPGDRYVPVRNPLHGA